MFTTSTIPCSVALPACKWYANTMGKSIHKILFPATALLPTRLGLHTTCGRVTTEQLHKAPLPCILHWNQNHFVVLYRIKKGKIFYIADPGKGLVTYDNREFKEHWLSTRSNVWGTERNVYWGLGEKDIKPIDIQKVVQCMSGWLCKTKRLRGFNLQLHLGAF